MAATEIICYRKDGRPCLKPIFIALVFGLCIILFGYKTSKQRYLHIYEYTEDTFTEKCQVILPRKVQKLYKL